ncbi:hypothetical protein JCM5353_006446 [Sporobolomyces roseus]
MHLPPSQTAASLLQSLNSLTSHRFSSNCASLDSLLTPTTQLAQSDEPGLPRGAVLELIGPPGIGKSRIAMAFALAECFRLEGGEVLVIDAEGSLNPSLLHETATAYAVHNGYESHSLKKVLESLLYRRIDSAWLLVAFFNTLESWLDDHTEVNLIVIDSLTSHLRPTLDSQTRRLMTDLIRSTLTTICASRRVSFIITTKMSIKLFGLDNRPSSWSRDAEAMMVPAIRSNEWLPSQERLGEGVWKVLLYFDQQGERLARLLESPVETQATDVGFIMDAFGPYDHQVPMEMETQPTG